MAKRHRLMSTVLYTDTEGENYLSLLNFNSSEQHRIAGSDKQMAEAIRQIAQLIYAEITCYESEAGQLILVGHGIIKTMRPILRHLPLLGQNPLIIDLLDESRRLEPNRAMPSKCPNSITHPITRDKEVIDTHSLVAWAYRLKVDKAISLFEEGVTAEAQLKTINAMIAHGKEPPHPIALTCQPYIS